MPPMPLRCAVLIAGSPADDTPDSPLGQEYPLHLTPLLGKNPLLYAVETLVFCGIQRIICMGWDQPSISQAQLGDGQRWGCQIEWHSLSGPRQAFDRMADIAPEKGSFLVANTVCLMHPEIGKGDIQNGTYFVPFDVSSDNVSVSREWGWAWIDRAKSEKLASGAGWRQWGREMHQICQTQEAVACVDLNDGAALLRAITSMLTRQFPVVIDGSEIEPGIFVSRNVVIHPTAELTAPVYVGADVEIGRQCHIGPGVALGQRSYIGSDTRIEHAQLGPDSWLGSSLDIERSVAWRGVIWSERYRAEIPIVDAGLLSFGSSWRWRRVLVRQLGRVIAIIVGLLLLPVIVLIACMHQLGLPGRSVQMVVIPVRPARSLRTQSYISWLGAHPHTRGWRHAVGFVLPNLLGVVQGHWYLVGLQPRTPAQWGQLPPAHQHWLAGRPCGLIQEACLTEMAADDILEEMVLDRYQDMRSNSLRYSMGILRRYLFQLVSNQQVTLSEKEKTSWI